MRAISLRLDGEASELEVAALERHLAVCPRCREIAAETASLTYLLREAPLVELERPVVVTSPRRVRKKVVRRTAAGILVAAGLAAAGLGITRLLGLRSEAPELGARLPRPARAAPVRARRADPARAAGGVRGQDGSAVRRARPSID